MSSADVSARVDPYLVLVTDVRVLGRYVLELTFDTGETKILDMEPLMWGPVFQPVLVDPDELYLKSKAAVPA